MPKIMTFQKAKNTCRRINKENVEQLRDAMKEGVSITSNIARKKYGLYVYSAYAPTKQRLSRVRCCFGDSANRFLASVGRYESKTVRIAHDPSSNLPTSVRSRSI